MRVAVVGLAGVGSIVTGLPRLGVGHLVVDDDESNLPRLIAVELDDVDARKTELAGRNARRGQSRRLDTVVTASKLRTVASTWLHLAITRRRQPEATAPSPPLRRGTEACYLRRCTFYLVNQCAALP
ncbi:ThiF family adenylyltransferase [Amycolatopsis sp. NBC_00348]|uniref:hypothetical protein n=1 Tax=Amycolatopsis sp. NBC_00348 TaxID=2975956 RepID=UPI002E27230C